MNEMTNTPALVAKADADSTAARLAQLRELGQQAGELLYDRVALASKVLADSEWVEVQGGYDLALGLLEGGYFPDLKVTSEFSLDHLLVLLDEFPAKDQWREQRWSVKRLWAAHELRRSRPKEPPKASQTQAAPADVSGPRSELSTANGVPGLSPDRLPKQEQSEVERLRAENSCLKAEVRRLRKKLNKAEVALRLARTR